MVSDLLKRYPAAGLALIFTIFSIGYRLYADRHPVELPDEAYDSQVVTTGVVTRVDLTQKSTVITLRADSIDSQTISDIKILVYTDAGAAPPHVGDRLSVRSMLRPMTDYGDIPYEESVKRANQRRGIAADTYASADHIDLIGFEPSWQASLARQRLAIVDRLGRQHLNDNTFGILSALLVGYDDELNPAMRDDFRIAGVAHILALSGFHVGIIIMLISLALYPLRISLRLRPWRLILAAILLWGYAALTAFPPSVVRAVTMATILLLNKLLGQRHNIVNSLALAWTILIIIWPMCIFEAGTQLSFAAVLGILAFARQLNPVKPRNRVAYTAVSLVTVPVGAVLGTLPVTVAWFHAVPLLFLISNTLLAIIIPILMIGGLLLLAVSFAGTTWMVLSSALNGLTDITADAIGAIARCGIARIDGLYLTAAAIASIIVVVAALAVIVNTRDKRYRLIFTGIIVIFCCLMPIFSARPEAFSPRVARRNNATTIISRQGNSLIAVHSCRPTSRDRIIADLTRATEPYRRRNGIDTLIMPEGDFSYTGMQRLGDTVTVDNRRIAIARTAVKRDTVRRPAVDLLLIGNRFAGDAGHLLDLTPCDTVLIGVELRRDRAAKVIEACDMRGVPYIDLRRHRPSL